MAEAQHSLLPPPPIVALAAWFCPGAGYLLIGQRARGLTVGIAIILLFLLGILIAGVRVVDAPQVALAPDIVPRLLEKPAFLAQAMVGPLGLAAAWVSHWAATTPQYANILAYSRRADIGLLYTAVAGLLNLLTIIDASYRAARQQAREARP